jgi:hypothetical protein
VVLGKVRRRDGMQFGRGLLTSPARSRHRRHPHPALPLPEHNASPARGGCRSTVETRRSQVQPLLATDASCRGRGRAGWGCERSEPRAVNAISPQRRQPRLEALLRRRDEGSLHPEAIEEPTAAPTSDPSQAQDDKGVGVLHTYLRGEVLRCAQDDIACLEVGGAPLVVALGLRKVTV